MERCTVFMSWKNYIKMTIIPYRVQCNWIRIKLPMAQNWNKWFLNVCGNTKDPNSQTVISCPVLTVASWHEYRFLRRPIRWFGSPISFKNFPQCVVIHPVKGFHTVNEAEVDVFLEFPCFLYGPTNVGNLIFAFSKSSMYIWMFSVHVLLKPT